MAVADIRGGRSERLPERWDHVDLADRPLARELATGALRYAILYDALAGRFLRDDCRPPPLMAALGVAAHQVFTLDRVPSHAIGHATVDGLRRSGHDRLCGVANAVIRRLLELRAPPDASAPPGPLQRLQHSAWPSDPATRHALPALLVADLPRARRDDDHALAALSLVPELCTRSRPGRSVADDPAISARDGDWLWWRDPAAAMRLAVVPGHALVQDRAQGRAVELAGLRAGELVIDCCAAPGGKTAYLRDLGGRVIAADRSPRKVARLRRAQPGPCLIADGARPALAAASADLVVVDAPCSNSGVFGRRPEAKARYQAATLAELQALQHRLLSAACSLARPAGRVLYATCSVSPGENRELVDAVCTELGWRVAAEHAAWPGVREGGGYAALLTAPAA